MGGGIVMPHVTTDITNIIKAVPNMGMGGIFAVAGGAGAWR